MDTCGDRFGIMNNIPPPLSLNRITWEILDADLVAQFLEPSTTERLGEDIRQLRCRRNVVDDDIPPSTHSRM